MIPHCLRTLMVVLLVLGLANGDANEPTDPPTTAPEASWTMTSTSSSYEPVGTKVTSRMQFIRLELYQDDHNYTACNGTSIDLSVYADISSVTTEGEKSLWFAEPQPEAVSAYLSYYSKALRACVAGETAPDCCFDVRHLSGWCEVYTEPTSTSTSQDSPMPERDFVELKFDDELGATVHAALVDTGSTSSFSTSTSSSTTDTTDTASKSASAARGIVNVVAACSSQSATVETSKTSERCWDGMCAETTITKHRELCVARVGFGNATATGIIRIPDFNVKVNLTALPEQMTMHVRTEKNTVTHHTVAV
ncbi:hypothetical protein JKP88DRAFT_242665 [Tribonema minus]|uniref:Uncharacterized protein n=1 Tax=Tribonema minus TaxID=303371 RepID=A0A835ZGS7_9STRA|nr:hypothetical protein JKP88DRAFT_242665 [Tribonema minus]